MKHTNVNIDIGSIDYAQALARFFFELKEIMVSAGWIVRGSGDGSGRYALDGVTVALDPGQQGSGGDFDCWMTDGVAGLGTPGGAWAQGAWALLEEPVGGGGRQYIFQLSALGTPVVGQYGGYGAVAYSRVGDFDGGTPDHNTAPTSATAQFLLGSGLNGYGASAWYNINDLYRAHVWADDAPVNGACGFGGFATRSTNTVQSFVGQLPLGPSTHVASDGDPTVHLSLGVGLTLWRWLMHGTGSAAWQTVSSGTGSASFWQGGGPTTDARDAIDRIAKVPLYQGSAATEQLAGETEHMRWSASPRAYPDFCRDQDGACWVWTATGILMPWEDAAAPALPPTPE